MMDQSEIAPLLMRTNELLTVLVKAQLSATLERELDDDKKKRLYDATGRGMPIKEISGKVGMSPASISRTWQRWEQAGLVVKDGKAYRRII